MIEPTQLNDTVESATFFAAMLGAASSGAVENLLAQLPVAPEDEYAFNPESPEAGWREGKFHWVPVGHDRGNAGRIKLANLPVNPIAERAINGMEAIIELARQEEILTDAALVAPTSPRDAVSRYFGLPPMDQIPKLVDSAEARKNAREIARKLRVRLKRDKTAGEFTVTIEDDGIGQSPQMVHRTLLSLGSTTKADKQYLIGVFGQGGSSAYAVCKYSSVVSRRALSLLGGVPEGAGWTIVKHMFPRGRRDDYFAYLAAHPDGRVPVMCAADADAANLSHGTRFSHIGYNFQKGGSTVARQLFPALNHVLYNPILPLELYALRDTPDIIYGNGFRLSALGTRGSQAAVLDKVFPPQPVGI